MVCGVQSPCDKTYIGTICGRTCVLDKGHLVVELVFGVLGKGHLVLVFVFGLLGKVTLWEYSYLMCWVR